MAGIEHGRRLPRILIGVAIGVTLLVLIGAWALPRMFLNLGLSEPDPTWNPTELRKTQTLLSEVRSDLVALPRVEGVRPRISRPGGCSVDSGDALQPDITVEWRVGHSHITGGTRAAIAALRQLGWREEPFPERIGPIDRHFTREYSSWAAEAWVGSGISDEAFEKLDDNIDPLSKSDTVHANVQIIGDFPCSVKGEED